MAFYYIFKQSKTCYFKTVALGKENKKQQEEEEREKYTGKTILFYFISPALPTTCLRSKSCRFGVIKMRPFKTMATTTNHNDNDNQFHYSLDEKTGIANHETSNSTRFLFTICKMYALGPRE